MVVPLIGLGFGLRHLAHTHPAVTAGLLIAIVVISIALDRNRRRR